MSNWASLQEQLTGLPVVKRAKHGIHFDKGNGEILANFSGRPCHYLDGATWKPIDTKLLPLGDGYYGCPHSKVKVHPNGTVAVAGTNYVQRVELPSAQTGLLDGDKLIRKFSFGEQRMWVTEDGFKSEIQLNRIPTLTEARKLIATESGTLSKEYLRSLTKAVDSTPVTSSKPNGNIHIITTISEFRTWLASAVFPVTIDPDFSSQPDETASMDTWIASDANTTNYNVDSPYARIRIGKYFSIYRGLIKFDLSSIPDGSNISAAALGVTKGVYSYFATNDTVYIHRQKKAWVENQATYTIYSTGNNWTSSGGFNSADCEQTSIGSLALGSGDANNTAYSIPITASVKSDLDLGYGWLLKLSESYDPNYIDFWQSSIDTASKRPVLTVTYTAGGGITPIVQYYNQLRRNK